MEKICGRIRNVNLETRTFEIVKKRKVEYFYLTRSQIKKFKAYLQDDLLVELEYKNELIKRENIKAYDVIGFTKLIAITKLKRIVYFDMDTIKRGVQKVINRDGYKLFIDLEFTMPPYDHSGGTYPSEIVQYGFILEDNDGQIIYEDSSLVKVNNKEGINSRTLDFLNRKKEDFKNAATPKQFYKALKNCLEKYNPIIMVWGKNDISMLDSFYERNNLPQLTTRASFINLMQLIKNYYGLKHDIGLFNALSYFQDDIKLFQEHDALADALVTSMVYHYFKEYANKQQKTH